MKKVLITGALGQIGTDLSEALVEKLGSESVISCYHHKKPEIMDGSRGIYEQLDATKVGEIDKLIEKHHIDTIVHMASLLSANAEKQPMFAWDVNMNGLINVLEAAKKYHCAVFNPSSIAVFGPTSPQDDTPQDTILRPTSMYGVTKVSGELLCDYYFKKYEVDVRGLRYPGLISYKTEPGGGTTDYAVAIYFDAILKGSYTCYLGENTSIDMMYMPDAIKATIDLMEADPSKLIHRNAFNVSAMAFTPAQIAKSIQKVMPEFTMHYDIDPVRQGIADSWPNSIDDSAARAEWGWKHDFDLDTMTHDMLKNLKVILKK